MLDPVAMLDEYLRLLRAAGIRAVVDAGDINPPAVQMRIPVLNYRFGRGCYNAEWTARLIMPDTGQHNAFRAAVPLIEQIQDALSGVIVTARPADYALVDGGGPVPGFELTWITQ